MGKHKNSQKSYRKEFLEKLKDVNKLPSFERPGFLDELNRLADASFDKQTVEGHLAALLIYHQLCEEMIKLLIKCSTFYIQCAIFPLEIKPKKQKGKKQKDKMFGELMNELEQGITFSNFKGFKDKCWELNNLRIEIVHNITSKTSVEDIKHQVKKAKKLFNGIFDIFQVTWANYYQAFKDYKENIEALKNRKEYI